MIDRDRSRGILGALLMGRGSDHRLPAPELPDRRRHRLDSARPGRRPACLRYDDEKRPHRSPSMGTPMARLRECW